MLRGSYRASDERAVVALRDIKYRVESQEALEFFELAERVDLSQQRGNILHLFWDNYTADNSMVHTGRSMRVDCLHVPYKPL